MKELRAFSPVILFCWFVPVFASAQSTEDSRAIQSAYEFFDKVDIGGRRLYIYCVGSGTPTVILDAGAGDASTEWGETPKLIGAFARVCRFDRANLGESDPAPKPRTSQQMVEDLHSLLATAGISAPYVLVGHSIAGFNVRLYASKYPQDVVGVVLVDSSHPDQASAFLALLPEKSGCPDQIIEEIREECQTFMPKVPITNREGMDRATSAAQVRAIGTLGNIPLVVLTSTQHGFGTGELAKKLDALWLSLQKDLVAISSKSWHILVPAGHYIQADQPEIVANAVRQVIDSARAEH